MLKAIKNFLKKKDLASLMYLVAISGIAIFCYVSETSAKPEKNTTTYIADTGIKCRECGKNLKHKGFFCSEQCREVYGEKYRNARYGKANCRNCGKEFTKSADCDYFCSEECRSEYYGDLKLVTEAEKFRKQGS